MTASFTPAWLAGDPTATAFLDDGFRRADARRQAAELAGRRPLSPDVRKILTAQNRALPQSPARERSLEVLTDPRAVVVVTGQQVGLFGGPLFTLYKAASAIVTARAITQETQRPCIPVFWLQVEDHDLPEINHVFIPGDAGLPLKVSVDTAEAKDSRVPVGQCLLPATVTAALQTLRFELEALPFAAEHVALLEQTYRPGSTYAQAFVQLLARVFSEEGLLFFDPSDASVAPLAQALHRRSLNEAARISEVLGERCQSLIAANFSEQVHIRSGAPLSFYAPQGPQGARYRLEPATTPQTWRLVGHPDRLSLSHAALLAELEDHPLHFSTSALLRPLLQDTLFPTVGYIGGPGEIAYFCQLPPLYAHWGIPMPLIIPRARFRIIDERCRNLLEKIGLNADQVCAGALENVTAHLATQTRGGETPDALRTRLLQTFQTELNAFETALRDLDPTLIRSLQRTRGTVETAVSRLVGKYTRTLARNDAVLAHRVEKLRHALLPLGAPQERIYGMAFHASRASTRGFLETILAATHPYLPELRDLLL